MTGEMKKRTYQSEMRGRKWTRVSMANTPEAKRNWKYWAHAGAERVAWDARRFKISVCHISKRKTNKEGESEMKGGGDRDRSIQNPTHILTDHLCSFRTYGCEALNLISTNGCLLVSCLVKGTLLRLFNGSFFTQARFQHSESGLSCMEFRGGGHLVNREKKSNSGGRRRWCRPSPVGE